MQTPLTSTNVADVKSLIDQRLNEYLETRLSAAERIGDRYVLLWKVLEKLLSSGGKRLRPFMLFTAYQAYSNQPSIDSVVPAALAQELVHQAVLIHDDIIDRDTIRYGVNNVTGNYLEIYTSYISDEKERRHMAESTALLAGDVLLSDAYRLVSNVDVPSDLLVKATRIFSDGIYDVIGGELLDTESAFLGKDGVVAEVVARYKTASYSFESPLTVGAVLAGADDNEIAKLTSFSEYLGIAYQYQDDLLGVFGDSQKTGKSTSTDISEGKQTYLIEKFNLLASEEQKQEFAAIFHHSNLTEEQLATARELLKQSGAKAEVETTIASLVNNARRTLEELSISQHSKGEFERLIELCVKRDK